MYVFGMVTALFKLTQSGKCFQYLLMAAVFLCLLFVFAITVTVIIAGPSSDALQRIFGDVAWPVYITAIGLLILITSYIISVIKWYHGFFIREKQHNVKHR